MAKKHIKMIEKELKVCPPGVCPSELRFDLVSKDWITIATARAKRPETFKREKRKVVIAPKKTCPFCHLETQEKPTLIFTEGKKVPFGLQPTLRPPAKDGPLDIPKNWTTIVIPNKFPAFARDTSLNERTEGPYQLMDAMGFHEVVITRDHVKQIAQFSIEQIKEVIDAYQERYLNLMNEKFVNYVSIFHNQGAEAGASVFHPHSQIIAMPLTDPDIQSSLQGSERFFEENKKCVHCVMIDWDLKDGRRIIFKNKDFVVLCPFASRVAFETRIFPLKHHAYFERVNEEQKWALAEALQQTLKRVFKGLNDPAYNFFLHTAPCDGKNYDHYHWHFEVLPKTGVWAGFELGTGIEISTIEPEKAAEYLRKQ